MARRTTRTTHKSTLAVTRDKKNTRNAEKSITISGNDLHDTADAEAPGTAAPPAHPNPKIFVFPSSNPLIPADVTVITLPHPSSHTLSHYLLHSVSGLHEIRRVAYPLSVPRSWLITPDMPQTEDSYLIKESVEEEGVGGRKEEELEKEKEEDQEREKGKGNERDWLGQGQVVPDSSLYICTPIDPLFLFVEHLTAMTHYLPLDDIIDPLIESSSHWGKALEPGTGSEALIKSRIRSICDQVDAGGEPSYRLSKSKLLRAFAGKCEAMIAGNGLPGTMEDEFVRKVLAKPIGSNSAHLMEGKGENKEENELEKGYEPTQELPTDNSFDRTINSSPSTTTITPPIPTEITHLQRIRVASQYLSTYLPPQLAKEFSAHLEITYDFTPLDIYLSDLAKLKHELSFYRAGNFSMKSSIEEQEGAGMNKKRKREEEEQEKKRKRNLSTGVRNLAKVDTKGMAKMTSFFKKK